jgi:hypothetical protein
MTQLDRIEKMLEQATGIQSPWLRGDKTGATYAGFKSTKGFRQWAKDNGVKASKSTGINTWSRRDIDAARERGKA